MALYCYFLLKLLLSKGGKALDLLALELQLVQRILNAAQVNTAQTSSAFPVLVVRCARAIPVVEGAGAGRLVTERHATGQDSFAVVEAALIASL